jgi:alanyl-tRNA synthetase
MPAHNPKSFSAIALAAFPRALAGLAQAAEQEVGGWVDPSYRTAATRVEIDGRSAVIPYRIHFKGLADHEAIETISVAAVCLISRSTDGYLRQRAIRRILNVQEKWVAPYIVLPLGEYVDEISSDIFMSLAQLKRDIYAQFVLENRSLMRSLRARAISYWDCYYRASYPERRGYPALAALHGLETWAADR